MFEKFAEWEKNRHEYARAWKERTGGKIVGYFCTYVPEELLYAAGVLPVRIFGSHEVQDVTEPHIFGMFCPYCRDCLAQGLLGRYDYLDGIMIAQSCLHIRQAFTSWQKHIPVDYSYYLPMPHNVQSPHALRFLRSELEVFKKSLEKWLGKTITDEDLKRAIDTYNQNRRLMRQVYEARKPTPPKLTGKDAMEMVLSSQMVDKHQHNEALTEVVAKLEGRTADLTGTRLMIIGSEDDDIPFISMVESLGATFVIDDHCTGSRYFWNDVETSSGDLLEALAARYINRPPCPSKDWVERRRIPHILKLAKEYGVQGALLIQQKFCDPHELDIPAIQDALKREGIPSLFLEFDITVPVGQFRTRVEAFLEMLGEEDLF